MKTTFKGWFDGTFKTNHHILSVILRAKMVIGWIVLKLN